MFKGILNREYNQWKNLNNTEISRVKTPINSSLHPSSRGTTITILMYYTGKVFLKKS